jgi:hypothetical protein
VAPGSHWEARERATADPLGEARRTGTPHRSSMTNVRRPLNWPFDDLPCLEAFTGGDA